MILRQIPTSIDDILSHCPRRLWSESYSKSQVRSGHMDTAKLLPAIDAATVSLHRLLSRTNGKNEAPLYCPTNGTVTYSLFRVSSFLKEQYKNNFRRRLDVIFVSRANNLSLVLRFLAMVFVSKHQRFE